MPNRMAFFDLLLFAVMVSFFVIGIHQSVYHGVMASYWAFMLSMLAFLWLNQRLRKKKVGEAPETPQPEKTRKRKKS
jgi:hypothetical protein